MSRYHAAVRNWIPFEDLYAAAAQGKSEYRVPLARNDNSEEDEEGEIVEEEDDDDEVYPQFIADVLGKATDFQMYVKSYDNDEVVIGLDRAREVERIRSLLPMQDLLAAKARGEQVYGVHLDSVADHTVACDAVDAMPDMVAIGTIIDATGQNLDVRVSFDACQVAAKASRNPVIAR